MPGPIFANEREFQQHITRLAGDYGWEPFHIPRAAYRRASDAGDSIPAGFPDLLLRYRGSRGNRTMMVAELKTDSEVSNPHSGQISFLEDFAQHMPAFIWRPRDLDDIERILREGPPDPTGEIIEPSAAYRNKPWPPPELTIAAIVSKLVRDIGDRDFPRGSLAELRRMNPDEPDAPAFWQLAAKRELSGVLDEERKWALVIHGIALMTFNTRNAHDGTPVGRALFEGGDRNRENAFYSDFRLNRLLKARGSTLRTLLTELFHMMGSAGQPFNWIEMASFILNEGDAAEKSRYEIARTYYNRAERRSSQERN